MKENALNIGIALSGGGVRAAVFHLGVLSRLAADHILERVTFISSVSGGTLVTGLIYSVSGNRWPSSEAFLDKCLPLIRQAITKTNIQKDGIIRLLTQPWLLYQGKAKILSESIKRCWGVSGTLRDIPCEPRWIINATAYESGKNWRFMPQRMGDYVLNYAENPVISLSDAMAASAAYPGLIGPYRLNTRQHKWFMYAEQKRPKQQDKENIYIKQGLKIIHLWDGGIYDNLGVECLFKPHGDRFRKEYNFLIVSDASKGIEIERPFFFYKRAFRLVNIAMDQVRSLRARNLVSHFMKNTHSGVYLRIGNSPHFILSQAGIDENEISALSVNTLSDNEITRAAYFPTTLRQLNRKQFDCIFQHGWEVADFTLFSRCPDYFSHRDFMDKYINFD
ncbi:MAG: patatin-like phospholipase family protein [bacterium]